LGGSGHLSTTKAVWANFVTRNPTIFSEFLPLDRTNEQHVDQTHA
jgi:hypothetical protein